jgi:hypothetical protein
MNFNTRQKIQLKLNIYGECLGVVNRMMKAAVRETHKGESVMQKKEHKLQYPVA